MGKRSIPSAGDITEEDFKLWLDRYPACIMAISDAKGVKEGQRTLAELDQYRYGQALDEFSAYGHKTLQNQEDLVTLMEWKLRHGKFRPTLMSLIKSNAPDQVRDAVRKGIDHYVEAPDSNVMEALKFLSALKGVGPATASLLLAVHDPEKRIFFSDEAYYWLCCDGKQAPLKYNMNEYKALCAQTSKLVERLGVRAVDIEKVAFVLMREPAISEARIKDVDKVSEAKETGEGRQSAKRKAGASAEAEELGELRRSSRRKGT